MTNEQQSTTKEPLEPCPKCNDNEALKIELAGPPLRPKYVRCGRCGFNAPFDTWQSRPVSALVDSEVAAQRAFDAVQAMQGRDYSLLQIAANTAANIRMLAHGRPAPASAAPVVDEQVTSAMVIEALRMMVELWDANNPDDPCGCVGASDDCKYPPPCELCCAREALRSIATNGGAEQLSNTGSVAETLTSSEVEELTEILQQSNPVFRERILSAVRAAAATAAPVEQSDELVDGDQPLTDAQVDTWLAEHKDDPVDPAQTNRVEWLFRKKLAASITDKAKEWLRFYDERIAQGGKGAQDMERLYGEEAAFHREVIRAVETLALEPPSAAPASPAALRDEAVSLNVDVDEQGEIVFGPTTPPSTLAKAATDEIVKGWFWHLPERDQERARTDIKQIIERCFSSGGESDG